MSRVDDVSAAPATDGPAATDDTRTTDPRRRYRTDDEKSIAEQDPDPGEVGRSALERALDALGIDEEELLGDTGISGDEAATAAGIQTRQFHQLRMLKEHANGLNAQVRDLGPAIKALEHDLVRAYGDAGVDSVSIGGYTGSLACRTWVSPADGVDAAQMCEVFRAYGGEWAALAPPKYHAQQLSSHVNALDELGTELPEEIEAVIQRKDVWGVGFRKAARGRKRGKRVPTTGD